MVLNKQIGLGLLACLLILIVSLSDCVKETEKVYRVGILSGIDPMIIIADDFKSEMTELGYIEGKNIVYNLHKTNFEPDKEQQILEKFVDDKVDLIFTFPTEVSLAAKDATHGTEIPVVFAYATIEGNNLVDSVRQPGGHITGVREPGTDIFAKRLEILHELAPEAKRVYITYDPNTPFISPALAVLRKGSSLMNITLVENPVTTVEDIKADLQARNESADIGMDAMLLMSGYITVSPPALEAMTEFAAEHKIPIGGIGDLKIKDDVIFSYEVNIDNMGKLAAPIADKIFRGITAGTIPVVTPEAKLLINYKLAKDLNLTVSEGLLAMADEIIR